MSENSIGFFSRGSTFSGNGQFTVALTDGTEFEGQEVVFQDFDWSVSPFGPRANGNCGKVRCRIVRNVSGGALLPKTLVKYKAGFDGSQVDGAVSSLAARCFPVDEFLPAAGVANNDLFYIVVEGYATLLTPAAGDGTNVIAAGAALVSAGEAGGRVTAQVTTGATTPLASQLQNKIGYAVGTGTTANTSTGILANITKF